MCAVRYGFIVVFFCFFAFLSSASADVFTDLGLSGGTVYAIAVDPDNPHHLFAGIYLGDGLYMSTDGGATFQPVVTGNERGAEAEFNNHAIYDVTFAPSDSRIIWATNNIFMEKSDDGGTTWTHITNSIMQIQCTGCLANDNNRKCRSIAIDPQDPDIVYVGTGGSANTSGTTGAVYKTTDGGASWTKLNGGMDVNYQVTDVEIDPQNSQRIFITTASRTDGYGTGNLYLSTDGGVSFSPVNPGNTVGAYYGVAVDPADSNTVYTGCDYGLFRHRYQDSAWTLSYAHNQAIFVKDPVFSTGNPARLYAPWFSSANFGGDNQAKVSYSDDGGATWETTSLDTMAAFNLNVIAVSPSAPSVLYAGDNSTGCLLSTDGGLSFAPRTQGIHGVLIYDVAVDPRETGHMLAGSNAGLFERPDAVSGWTRLLPGIVQSVCFDPASSQTLYAGISFNGNQLYISRNGGGAWSQSPAFTSGISHIAIDPENTQTLYLTEGTRVQKSTDGGETFDPIMDAASYNMNVVVIDPTNPQHLFAGGGNFYYPRVYGSLFESTDSGTTWTETGLTNAIVNDVLIHPENPLIMYAGCGYSSNYEEPLLKSVDGGLTWQRADLGFPNLSVGFQAIWAPSADEFFAVGYSGAAYQVTGGEVRKLDSGVGVILDGISGVTGDDVYAVGRSGTILHYDGNAWSAMACPVVNNIIGVLAYSQQNVFAVGASGVILHYDGTQWETMASPTVQHLEGVFGFSPSDVYAVGWTGTILHYNGTDWSAMVSQSTENLLDIWGSDPSHLYCVSVSGSVLTYDGNGQGMWSTLNSGDAGYLAGVCGTTDGRVFVADAYDGVYLLENNTVTLLDMGRDIKAMDVWCTPDNHVLVCDFDGGLFSFDGTTWTTLRAPGDTGRTVVDLEFDRENPDIVYAATYKSGIYISPDQAGHWLNLGTPEYSVFAIATGSLYAATQGSLYQCTGTGVIAGSVSDMESGELIDGALVESDLGCSSLSVNGQYMMVTSAGICNVRASDPTHHDAVQSGVSVYGGEVSFVHFPMISNKATYYGIDTEDDGAGSSSVRSSGSDSGKFCFIGSLSQPGPGRIPWAWCVGVMVCLFGMTAMLRRPRMIVMASILLWPLSDGNGATLFQQVGMASSPNVVGSGARALGMGGAFIATADDATASSWNPSGLVQVEQPELSLVGDFRRETLDFSSGIHPEIDNRERENNGKANYLSATYPFHAWKNMVVSLNYQRLYDFDRNLSFTYDYNVSGVDLVQEKSFSQSGSLGALGLAWAMEMTPRFSLGLTVNVWTDQLGWNNSWHASYLDTGTGTQGGAAVSLTNQIDETYSNFRGVNANVGLLWEAFSGFTLGAVLKTPFDADARHTYHSLSTSNLAPDTRYDLSEQVTIHMPLSYGLGAACRMSDRLTLACDVYHTLWSDYKLEDAQGNRFNPIDGLPVAQSDVSDTLQVRTGGEYLFLFPEQGVSVPLRAGLFYDPEPAHGSVRKFYGASLGSGISINQCSVDLAYQCRWSFDVDTGNLIATSTADAKQHTVLASVIFYF